MSLLAVPVAGVSPWSIVTMHATESVPTLGKSVSEGHLHEKLFFDHDAQTAKQLLYPHI